MISRTFGILHKWISFFLWTFTAPSTPRTPTIVILQKYLLFGGSERLKYRYSKLSTFGVWHFTMYLVSPPGGRGFWWHTRFLFIKRFPVEPGWRTSRQRLYSSSTATLFKGDGLLAAPTVRTLSHKESLV